MEKVLADIAHLLDAQQAFDPARSSRIFRIAGSDHASRMILAPLSQLLVEAGSSVRLLWEPPGSWPLAERLHKGELDLAAVSRIKRPQDMETEVLYQDHYVYVMRKDHPRAGEPVTLDGFCRIPQVFLGYGTSTLDDLIDETLARTGHQRLAQIAVTSFGQILHQLRHSEHAAVLGRRVALHYADELHVQPLPFELPGYQSLLCWAERFAGDSGIQWLRSRIAAIVARTMPDRPARTS